MGGGGSKSGTRSASGGDFVLNNKSPLDRKLQSAGDWADKAFSEFLEARRTGGREAAAAYAKKIEGRLKTWAKDVDAWNSKAAPANRLKVSFTPESLAKYYAAPKKRDNSPEAQATRAKKRSVAAARRREADARYD